MSNNSTATASSSGIGLFGLVFIVLLVFKLAGEAGASWGLASLSWFWVFSPLLVGFAIFIVVAVFMLIFAIIASK